MIGVKEDRKPHAKIMVVGVGGGGNNAINRLVEEGVEDIKFISVNTDAQILEVNSAPHKIQIGEKLTGGLGAGANPEIGAKAAEESIDAINEAISDVDMIFITAGMGGGTGTGATPIIAEVAKSKGILTVAVVTKPFEFEMNDRMQHALSGIAELKKHVDTLIVIPNERLIDIASTDNPDLSLQDAFKMADTVLAQSITGVSDMITKPGVINLDFADIRTTMLNKGIAHIGVGRAKGKNKAEEAAKLAINSQLLDTTIDGAKNLLINITGNKDLNILEVNRAIKYINTLVSNNVKTIFGSSFDDTLEDEIIITIVATNLPGEGDNSVNPIEEVAAENNIAATEEQAQVSNPEEIKISEPVLDPISSTFKNNRDKPISIPSFLQKMK